MKFSFRLLLSIVLVAGAFPAAGNAQDAPVLVLRGGKIYPSPNASPIENAVVVVENGRIVSAQKLAGAKIPKGAKIIDTSGKVIVAGFWNSHVHFENGWHGAAQGDAGQIKNHIEEMVTRWGFTTVWDLGSEPQNTLALRGRIAKGEIPGPQILMAGDIFPLHGHPVYLPPEMQLPEAATPQQAAQMATDYLKLGLEGIKLFTGAFMGDKPIINMDTAMVKAAVDVAHAAGKPVFAHPQNRTGVDNALAGGVDVLAHTIPDTAGYSQEELAEMKRRHTGLIPTLTLWTTVVNDPAITEQLVNAGVSELKAYFSEGGTILFGTDVGFIPLYDTTKEYEFMGRALGWRDVLGSLTTNPSQFFKQPTKGRVEKGMDADLVVLDADPASDVRNLARVAYTIRAGKVIYAEGAK
jgi:imidazolonepropionase-like amidohydrolase